jgi:actin related protein 2/3 complex subunit 1A/1B
LILTFRPESAAYVHGLDAPDVPSIYPRQPFGECLFESDAAAGWVESVAWSPSGNVLVACCHDATLDFYTFPGDGGAPVKQHLSMKFLPMLCSTFLADDTLVCAGFDFYPMLFTGNGQSW